MPLLAQSEYAKLKERNLTYEESDTDRFFVFTHYVLPSGMYQQPECDILVVIPPNYNQSGNDMFWTYPCLRRVNGVPIPAVNNPGGADNRVWNSREYCRWSRHWNPPSKGVWRPGRDDIITIYRRIDWALTNPDAQ
jgi:hypothetical protein